MKNIFLVAALLIAFLPLGAQTKLDLSLNHLVNSRMAVVDTVSKFGIRLTPRKVENNTSVSVLATLNEGDSLPVAALESLGVKVNNQWGRIVSLTVPVSALSSLDKMEEFKSFEQSKKLRLSNKISHDVEGVTTAQNAVLASQAGLSKTYTGKGVLVGVHDSGIDYNHNNFRDPVTHKTRLKEAIVYNGWTTDEYGSSSVTPAEMVQSYKKTYTSESDINQLTTDANLNSYGGSHGTHTSSTAAGSYNGKYVNYAGSESATAQRGTAYEADLVLSGTPALYEELMFSSLKDMDELATKLGEPLVVNLSLGANGGWMDGKTTACEFFDEFTDYGKKEGRVICVSAGNEGDYNFSLHKKLDKSNNYTLRTVLTPSDDGDQTGTFYYSPWLEMYSDDDTEFEVSIEVYSKSDKSLLTTFYTNDELVNNGKMTVAHYADHNNRFAAMIPYFTMNSSPYYLGLCIKSKDNKDCTVRVFSEDYIGDLLPLMGEADGFSGCTAGDNESTINNLAVTNSVLSVGAWSANRNFTSYTNIDRETSYPVNEIIYWSSLITCDDNGYSRPDFAAPGSTVISGFNCYNTYDWNTRTVATDLIGKASEDWSGISGHVSLLGQMSGTSMACPNATGVVALMLEANPKLTVNEIREIIKQTATNDEYTQLAPAQFGAGKLNALAALKKIEELTTGIEDNSLSSLISPLSSGYNLSGQRVNTNARGILIVNGKKVIR